MSTRSLTLKTDRCDGNTLDQATRPVNISKVPISRIFWLLPAKQILDQQRAGDGSADHQAWHCTPKISGNRKSYKRREAK